MEAPHSPFGIIWQIASATGWSQHRILWRINYQTLILMLSDQTRYVPGGTKPKKPRKGCGSGMVEFVQSKINEKK